MKPKQVIVVRKDLNMRRGKSVAQGAHASQYFLTENISDIVHVSSNQGDSEVRMTIRIPTQKYDAMREWLRGGKHTKICVTINSEEELDRIHEEAKNAGLPSYVVTDSGLTEFDGVPTKTALAIGPADSDEIDAITGKLPLW